MLRGDRMVTEVIFPVNRLPVSWQSFVAAEESYLGKWLVGAKPICSFRPFPQDSVICVLIMLMSKYASTMLLSICFNISMY